ncbi:MAG: rod shape-determining protein RodA [Candidatus Cyclobacteriaceae bacterium M2_1C_046]
MRRRDNILKNVDWLTILLYFLLVILGWLNIYAAVYDESANQSIFDLSLNSGKQLLFIGGAVILIIVIMSLDFKFYDTFSWPIFGLMLFLLVVAMFGREVAGTRGWIDFGPFKLQPSEFTKFATALAVARFISSANFKIDKIQNQLILFGIIALPALLIIAQGDTGTAMVFSIFLLVFFREGQSPIYLILGLAAGIIFILTLLVENHLYLYGGIILLAAVLIVYLRSSLKKISLVIVGAFLVVGVILSVDYIITDVMKPHQQSRIKALINPDADPLGYGWNVTQSKIAIGSGGLWGKGFLEGTQTKFDFVPEQSTDFIFCTIGEEHGWIGSILVIFLMMFLIMRVIFLAERQKWRFARVYGYSVASILFFHFLVNIGMTIGLFPVVGIPLPFFSYGGSSLWAFTILVFIMIKLDSHRMQLLIR